MSKDTTIIASQHGGAERGSLKSYITGFALSLLLTFFPYLIVVNGIFKGGELALVLVLFAIAQLLVQLKFFIHLGHESGIKWNMIAFLYAVLMVGIVVIGSLWIMHNLNYNMGMDPQEMNEYMQEQNGKGF